MKLQIKISEGENSFNRDLYHTYCVTYMIKDTGVMFQELQTAVTHTQISSTIYSLVIHFMFLSLSKKVHTEILVMANFFKYKDKCLRIIFMFHFNKTTILVWIETVSCRLGTV